MKEELRHELVRLTYSPEIVSFELTREQGLEILKEIKRLNNIINNLENELARVYEIELDYPIQFVKEEVEKVKLGVDKE